MPVLLLGEARHIAVPGGWLHADRSAARMAWGGAGVPGRASVVVVLAPIRASRHHSTSRCQTAGMSA
jgi:hypothetical protein